MKDFLQIVVVVLVIFIAIKVILWFLQVGISMIFSLLPIVLVIAVIIYFLRKR